MSEIKQEFFSADERKNKKVKKKKHLSFILESEK